MNVIGLQFVDVHVVFGAYDFARGVFHFSEPIIFFVANRDARILRKD